MLLHQFAICICKLVHRDWEIIEFFLEEWKNLSNLKDFDFKVFVPFLTIMDFDIGFFF